MPPRKRPHTAGSDGSDPAGEPAEGLPPAEQHAGPTLEAVLREVPGLLDHMAGACTFGNYYVGGGLRVVRSLSMWRVADAGARRLVIRGRGA